MDNGGAYWWWDELQSARKKIERLEKENEELKEKYVHNLNELAFTKGYASKIENENRYLKKEIVTLKDIIERK